MLKLTNSFYRYLRHTYERVDISVAGISNINSQWKICGVNWHLQAQFHTSPHLEVGKGKKRLRIKIPPFNSNETKNPKQMSESLQPTLNHASYGGTFEISSDDEGNSFKEYGQMGETSDESANAGDHARVWRVPLDFRVWEPIGKKGDTRDGHSLTFKVLSYNVLAQYLLECHPYLYTECAPKNLKWKVRSERLFDEITALAPDILCLQEVQASHIESFYSKFEQLGYVGIFKQKTGQRQDGCAIYFKQSLFELDAHVSVEYYQPELPILNRDNIGIMVKLAPRNMPGSRIVVATTHLLYNPKRTDVRLAQLQVLLAELDRFAYHTNGIQAGHLPIILTGDFNSTPESAVIQLLDWGQVCAGPFRDSSDWKRIGVTDNCQHLTVLLNRLEGQNTNYDRLMIYHSEYCEQSDCLNRSAPTDQFSNMFNSGVVRHSLMFASVYDHRVDRDRATTFADYWLTVDYIYFSCCTNLRLVDRLRLPTVSECDILGRLPNEVYGSDHLALAAVFELTAVNSTL